MLQQSADEDVIQVVTVRHGATSSNTSSLAWVMLSVWETFGGSHTYATEMAEVRTAVKTILKKKTP